MLRLACGTTSENLDRPRSLNAATSAARRGDLILVPTESVYALATDPFSSRGIASLRKAKSQSSQVPVPIMVPSAATMSGLAVHVGLPAARALMLNFWPGLLTLLFEPQSTLAWELPRDAPLAARMPLHPLLLELLRATGPLAVTGANVAGMPAATTVDDAVAQFGEAIVLALDVDELGVTPENSPADLAATISTVVDLRGAAPEVVRVGAVGIAELRAVCPNLVDSTAI
ncbi:MAG: threonylcarbamoyl-AMP synthase [Actinobacteria bacterium]|uniref:L-threonylcarbamoyladenylate synthase n=1 Tax=freshwater metagenome TaxID=449393 RepID=A0A6J6MD37_9ZZZZ|nr:threonylcarbamoyl-AMP synthase [Actinomycetota bacterium]MSX13139.1 threonylcarbamoyl-AMP synthase [Actinomycetota bacterium]MSY41159.1 threonylcarbamoyl-AMP synthase [Actinomycetota bacterium]MSY98422.1 threonylcarbamoyl-AMP synthase [Actinomycetota bacterium]